VASAKEHIAALRMLANQAMAQLDLRRNLAAVTRSLNENRRAEKELRARVDQLEAR